jgi:hypothetical protein
MGPPGPVTGFPLPPCQLKLKSVFFMALSFNMIVFLTVRRGTKTHGVKTAVIIPFVRICKLFVEIMNMPSGKGM